MDKISIAMAESFGHPLIKKLPTFDQLTALLERPTAGAKKGSFFVPAELTGGKRNLESVKNVSLLVLDLDNKDNSLSVERLNQILRSAQLNCCYHTTYRSKREHPRFRLAIATDCPIPPSDFKRVAWSVARSLGLDPDPQSIDASHAFYLPRCPSDQLDDFVFERFDGLPLEVAKFNQVPPNTSETSCPINAISPAQVTASETKALEGMLDAIPADCDRKVWLTVIWSIQKLGLPSGYKTALEWSQRSDRHWTLENRDHSQADFDRVWSEYRAEDAEKLGWDRLEQTAALYGYRPSTTLTTKVAPGGNNKLKVLSAGDVRDLPDMEWIIKNLIPNIGMCVLYGPSMSGKSFLALDIAFHISEGVASWFGFPCRQTNVAYLALEGQAGLKKRLAAWEKQNNTRVQRASFLVDQIDIRREADIAELVSALSPHLPEKGVVFIDTLNQAAPGADENSSVDMGLMIRACKQLSDSFNGVVILVHHTGKDVSKGLRGHSSLIAAIDFAIEVKRTRQGREWSIGKLKDEKDSISRGFELVVLEVGKDSDGDPVRSCAVQETSIFSEPKKPTGKNQIIALAALKVATIAEPISAEEAYEKIKVALLDSDSPPEVDRARGRAKEALAGLIKGGFVTSDDGLIDTTESVTEPDPL